MGGVGFGFTMPVVSVGNLSHNSFRQIDRSTFSGLNIVIVVRESTMIDIFTTPSTIDRWISGGINVGSISAWASSQDE